MHSDLIIIQVEILKDRIPSNMAFVEIKKCNKIKVDIPKQLFS